MSIPPLAWDAPRRAPPSDLRFRSPFFDFLLSFLSNLLSFLISLRVLSTALTATCVPAVSLAIFLVVSTVSLGERGADSFLLMSPAVVPLDLFRRLARSVFLIGCNPWGSMSSSRPFAGALSPLLRSLGLILCFGTPSTVVSGSIVGRSSPARSLNSIGVTGYVGSSPSVSGITFSSISGRGMVAVPWAPSIE